MTGNEFYDLLKEKKRTHGITQTDVAKALGFKAYQSVQMYFRNGDEEIDFHYSYIKKLAELLGEPEERFVPQGRPHTIIKSTGRSSAIGMYGGKAATATVGGTMLSPLEQTLIDELRVKDPAGVILRSILADLLKKSAPDS